MKQLFFILFFSTTAFLLAAQPITGVWRGKFTNGSGMFANTARAELKLVAKGDSLYGTCYYFSNANSYIRYSVQGYFDKQDNAVHWWDDQFLEVKPKGKTTVGVYANAMHSDADFNCPGNNVMKLDGKSQIGTDGPDFVLHFDKIEKPLFHDEWDNVIEGYFTGMADPDIIDSVYAISKPYKADIPTEVIAKVDDPDGVKKANGKTVPSIEKPAEVASNPPGEVKQQPAIETGAKTQPVIVIPSTEIKMADTQVIAKKEPVIEKPPVIIPSIKIEKVDTLVIVKKDPVVEKPVVVPAATVKTTPSTDIKTTSTKTVEPAIAKQTNPVVTNTPVSKPTPAVVPPVVKTTVPAEKKPESLPPATVAKTAPVVIKPTIIPEKIDPVVIQKFVTRKKIEQGEIPMVGDSIELNFYDNAEIDGDSISLFLNGKLLFNHVLLSAQAYTFKLGVKDLADGSELTMVAENLGSIPPNTAYMMAIVDGVRYSARLESTEQSSGVIRLVRR